MRIAITGEGNLAMSLMGPLLASRHEVVALVQNGRTVKPAGRILRAAWGRLLGPLAGVAGLAKRNGIPIVWIDRMTEQELAPLRATNPDVLLVGGFSIILKKPILEAPRIGCVNMHSSLLPKHRGPNPFSAVIIAGEEESGITFHQIDEGIDTGPILEQYTFPLRPQDTAVDVHQRACALAGLHVAEVMDNIERKGMYGRPQDPGGMYDKRLQKEDSYIDWSRPAREIERKVRGLRPLFIGRFRYGRYTVMTTRVRCEDVKETDAPPGTILKTSPFVQVVAGTGVVTLLTAFAAAPIPWTWPAPWNKIKPGDRVT